MCLLSLNITTKVFVNLQAVVFAELVSFETLDVLGPETTFKEDHLGAGAELPEEPLTAAESMDLDGSPADLPVPHAALAQDACERMPAQTHVVYEAPRVVTVQPPRPESPEPQLQGGEPSFDESAGLSRCDPVH